MKFKKILAMTIAILIFTTVGVFASNENVKVVIDGKTLLTDVPAQLVNGRTLVPVRAIFDEYDVDLYWDEYSRIVNAYYFDDYNFLELNVDLGIDSNIASINGTLKYLDQAATIINGRTMVPLRFISEVLGSDVSWNYETKTVNIGKNPIRIPKEEDYEIAFTKFINDGELKNILDKSYKKKNYPLYDIEISFYDIDRDGIPELVLGSDIGHATQGAIFEFKNGKINEIYSDLEMTEEMGATTVYLWFSHDPIKKKLYSYRNQKYTNWIDHYTKDLGFKEVFEDSSVGGGKTIYYDKNFNLDNLENLKMMPIYNYIY